MLIRIFPSLQASSKSAYFFWTPEVALDKNREGTKHLDVGGFAYGDVPKGFERIRPPHEDDPLTPKGRRGYYLIAVTMVLAALLVVVTAVIENG